MFIPVLTVVGTLLLGTNDDSCCGAVTAIGVSLTVTGTTGASSAVSITFEQSMYVHICKKNYSCT